MCIHILYIVIGDPRGPPRPAPGARPRHVQRPPEDIYIYIYIYI